MGLCAIRNKKNERKQPKEYSYLGLFTKTKDNLFQEKPITKKNISKSIYFAVKSPNIYSGPIQCPQEYKIKLVKNRLEVVIHIYKSCH